MEVTVKRKNIDLPIDILQKLSEKAMAQGQSLKAYIEQVLISNANDSINNPSPSGDSWFDNPQNKEEIKLGIADLKAGKSKNYSMDEIKALLGV